jgi:hypothetical protein
MIDYFTSRCVKTFLEIKHISRQPLYPRNFKEHFSAICDLQISRDVSADPSLLACYAMLTVHPAFFL